ncbi:MAG: hypothetical protein K0S47_4369 [Herbinix sp.]|jgi:hypothetical protein|nr:hypothetical protein [Herbinix sp.]
MYLTKVGNKLFYLVKIILLCIAISILLTSCNQTVRFSNGDKYRGVIKKNGIFEKGQISYVTGEVCNLEWNGDKYTINFTNGNKYIGEIKDLRMNGKGVMYLKDGSTYEGEFKDGKIEGYGTNKNSDGSSYVGEWKNGLRDGSGIITYPDGFKYSGEWRGNKIDLTELETYLEKEKMQLIELKLRYDYNTDAMKQNRRRAIELSNLGYWQALDSYNNLVVKYKDLVSNYRNKAEEYNKKLQEYNRLSEGISTRFLTWEVVGQVQ